MEKSARVANCQCEIAQLQIEDAVNAPSGRRVTAQPPPPAPVSLVESSYGEAFVRAMISSSDECETPSAARWSWFSLMRA